MTLINLKYTKAEAKAEVEGYKDGPEYPWGLQIRLEDDELNKLGIKTMPEVGGEFHLQVVAKITGVNESTMADGKYERCVNLQITMMGIDLQESAAAEKGEKETPKSEAKETKKSTLMATYKG